MENLIEINDAYTSLDKLHEILKSNVNYEYAKEYDIWEHRVDANGQMEQCLVIKKSNMHAIKVFFVNTNTVKINYIIPNKIMHAYFGKSVKARRNILQILIGTIMQAVLAGPQKKAFEELEQVLKKIAA